MTTPGGVPNLPQGALTIDNLADKTQDMSTPAMRARAAERFPNIFNSSTGGNALNDLTPIGIITQIFSGFNSVVANADPADVQGPEDLPGLLLDFIESLPVVGELVGLLEAILGTYTGDDPVLLDVQTIFAPIRAIVDSLTAVSGGLGGLGSFFPDLLALLGNPTGMGSGTTGLPGIGSIPILGGLLNGGGTNLLAALIPGLDASKITSGTFGVSLLQPIIDAVSQGFGGSTGLNFTGLQSFLGGLTFAGLSFDDLIALIPGATGGLTGPTGLGSIFTDLFGLLGSPTAVGSGTPALPGVGSIPVLGGLFSGSTFLGSLIPGLDASKITTGAFPVSMITNLATLLTGFGTSSSILTQLLGLIPGASGGLSGLTGLGSVFTDLFGLMGSPTAVGSGSPVLPGVTSRPILGGLFSGSTLAGGLIPGLDASKVTTGTFLDAFIPDLGFLRGGLFTALTGAPATTADLTSVQNATASQTDTVGGQGAMIAQLQAALGAGKPDADDFERASLGANWTFLSSTGTGTIPDSHNFHFSGTGTAEYVMRKNNLAGSTDHITSSIVLNQAIPASIFSLPPYGGNIDVWVRMTAFTTYATRTGVRLRINSSSLAGSWTLDWVNSGTVTNLASGSCSIPAAGTIISLEAGASATPRRFLGTFNGSPMGCDFNDAGLVTTIGSSNRYRGFGGKGASGIGLPQGTPDIRQWTAQG